MLECRHVSRWFANVIAVNDLTCEVGPGITGLLGPNGSGKSTLMRMCVGLLRPSTGSLRVLDEDPWDNPSLLRRIGYLPEAPAPWRELPGRDVLVRGARLAGLAPTDAADAAELAINRVGLREAAERPAATYSHGMQQRLKLALATLHDPEVLILDEPLLGTDPIARRDLLRIIKEHAKEGTVLVSTHVLPDVDALTDRILLMRQGRLMAHGTIGDIRGLLDQYPRTVRVATSTPRQLAADVVAWDDVVAVQAGEGAVLVQTTQADTFHARLQEHILAKATPVTSITATDESVEAVFEYLVRP